MVTMVTLVVLHFYKGLHRNHGNYCSTKVLLSYHTGNHGNHDTTMRSSMVQWYIMVTMITAIISENCHSHVFFCNKGKIQCPAETHIMALMSQFPVISWME